ncbi:Uu.00g087300.m01.CDS01 [Anthostomella pinea]|uniref:Uu.00g087300.m01.CDS01 n=1 Tax=Anthostomella pinea TaxID=933095 RepID=A0AAI8YHK3_9PEZI|nr:Uu.00g087300.m01.CDS01 [Anthostomella pinea]
MKLITTILLVVAGAATTPILASSVLPRQDIRGIYACSNPNFNQECDGCTCQELNDLATSGGYGPPPCFPLPYMLRPGPPQGVSSARVQEGYNCTLYDNANCDPSVPGSSLTIPPGQPGLTAMGPFDDRSVAYQCYLLPASASASASSATAATSVAFLF